LSRSSSGASTRASADVLDGWGPGVRLVRKGRAASNSAEPHIRPLGGFSVAVGDNVISDHARRLRKAKALIKTLALAPDRRLHRERLAELPWGRPCRRHGREQPEPVPPAARSTPPALTARPHWRCWTAPSFSGLRLTLMPSRLLRARARAERDPAAWIEIQRLTGVSRPTIDRVLRERR
jgi:hypothetical protein